LRILNAGLDVSLQDRQRRSTNPSARDSE
jgi:hypothetical protein